MNLLDAHCHLDLMQDPLSVAEEAEREGVVAISVTNAPSVFPYTRDLCAKFRNLRAAVGLHPELAVSHHGEVELFKEYLPQTSFVGEVGLDFVTTDADIRALQRKVFRSILDECALARGKVLTVHSRRSATAVLDEVGGDFPGIVILHWFSGTKKELKRAIDRGCLFSVNLAMLRSKSGQALVREMPREKVLTETDGPFATVGGKPAVPADIKQTLLALSGIWQCPESESRASVVGNFAAAMRRRESIC